MKRHTRGKKRRLEWPYLVSEIKKKIMSEIKENISI